MVGFGSLLWARRRLRAAEGPLVKVSPLAAKQAGRTLLLVAGVIAALVAFIVALRLHSGGALGTLSLLLPGAGLAWVTLLGLQVLWHREPETETPAADRPSRRPPPRDTLAKPTSGPPGPPDQHVNA